MTIRFRLLEDGRWSGGGSVLLANAREARERHPVLQGGAEAVPLLARNLAPRGRLPKRPFVLVPQNAWVWTPVASGAKERVMVLAMRVGTAAAYRASSGIVRISEAIRPGRADRTSEVLHNVLDRGFEDACEQAGSIDVPEAAGAFVSVGSNHTFRDLVSLVEAHGRYREQGGARRLLLIGPPGSRTPERRLDAAVRAAGGAVLRRSTASRAECLAAMMGAYAVVHPARVEASPIAVLESGVLAQRVLLTDISGHRGIVDSVGDRRAPRFFAPHDVSALAAALVQADDEDAGAWDPLLDSRESRQAARDAWGDRLAAFLTGLAGHLAPPTQKVSP